MGASKEDLRNDAVEAVSTITDVQGGRLVIAALLSRVRELTDKLALVDDRLFWMRAQASSKEECWTRAKAIQDQATADFSRRT